MTMNMNRRNFLKTTGAFLALPLIGQTSASFVWGTTIARTAVSVPVLLYHDISDQYIDEYTVNAAQFATQMEWLYSNGYQAISLSALRRQSIPGRTVVITFDDGYASFMDFAFPLLSNYGFKATINIIGEYSGSYFSFSGNRPMLSWDEYRYLSASGIVDLGCHTNKLHIFRHRGAEGVSPEALRKDLNIFQRSMVREIGKPAEIIAWPYGFYNKNTITVATHEGFTYMLTSKRGFFNPTGSLNEIPRINIDGDTDFSTFKSLI
jgi:peptidoglycan/xylan/chitin deacetylase (PgdA/CDA1 family)